MFVFNKFITSKDAKYSRYINDVLMYIACSLYMLINGASL